MHWTFGILKFGNKLLHLNNSINDWYDYGRVFEMELNYHASTAKCKLHDEAMHPHAA